MTDFFLLTFVFFFIFFSYFLIIVLWEKKAYKLQIISPVKIQSMLFDLLKLFLPRTDYRTYNEWVFSLPKQWRQYTSSVLR